MQQHAVELLGDFPSAEASWPWDRRAPEEVPRPSILLVDDDPHMLDVQVRSLQSMGYTQTTTALSAPEALLQVEHDPNSAQLIICDLRMPGMDGLEFLQLLNASPFRGSVILLSGESERVMHSVQKLIGGQQLTILGALTKPANRNALRALLECWRPRASACAPPAERQFPAEEVRAAVNQQQWVLHYQPQVDLKSGALVGLEALVRWQHPQLGIIRPDQFISTVEDQGLISELTDWVLRRALQDLAMWRGSEVHPHVAVNISMQSLLQPGYWRHIADLVREAGATPIDVVLEVTETRLAYSSLVPLENLVRLRLARFTLSIDDFGTGHSSLAQLRDVPFTELKVDRGFVHGARNNQIIRPMLEGSLGIARRLGMRSVAEGVETQDDWELLHDLDCDLAQGYFIGKPMSADQLLGWLVTWQARQALLVES